MQLAGQIQRLRNHMAGNGMLELPRQVPTQTVVSLDPMLIATLVEQLRALAPPQMKTIEQPVLELSKNADEGVL